MHTSTLRDDANPPDLDRERLILANQWPQLPDQPSDRGSNLADNAPARRRRPRFLSVSAGLYGAGFRRRAGMSYVAGGERRIARREVEDGSSTSPGERGRVRAEDATRNEEWREERARVIWEEGGDCGDGGRGSCAPGTSGGRSARG